MSKPFPFHNMQIEALQALPLLFGLHPEAAVKVSFADRGEDAFCAPPRVIVKLIELGMIRHAHDRGRQGNKQLACVVLGTSVHAALRIARRFTRPTLKDSTLTKPRGKSLHWETRFDQARSGCGGHSASLAGMAGGIATEAAVDRGETVGMRRIVGA